MRAAFFELNIGAYGLFAAQQGLSVTSNNITNSNTQGYSRQVINQQAGRPIPGAGTGMVGTGVNINGIDRVRNSYLDMKIWNQKPLLGEYKVKSEQSALIETVFGEPSEVGFTRIFNDFFNSLDNLSKIPDEGERKFSLMQGMNSVTQYFNNASESLEKYQRDLNFEVKNKVDEINMISRRLQSLNKQIYEAEIHGGTANSFRDEREKQIDRLSELINVEAKEYEIREKIGEVERVEKRYIVKVNGQMLVEHFQARELDVAVRKEKNNPEDVNGLYDVVWKDGLPFKMDDPNLRGELKGALDMRDGNGGLAPKGTSVVSDDKLSNPATITVQWDSSERNDFLNAGYILINGERLRYDDVTDDGLGNYTFSIHADDKTTFEKIDTTGAKVQIGEDVKYRGISYYIHRLNNFVREFAMSINEVYKDGVDSNGNKNHFLFAFEDTTDADMKNLIDAATNPADVYNKNLTAKNFKVSKDIREDVSKICTTIDPDKLPGGNDLILKLMEKKHDSSMFKEGEPNDYMVSIFSELGINAREANMYKKSQENITTAIENQRLSISQVDTNEEMVNLVKYQQAYQAAAKIISTMDSIYDMTINRLGAS